MQVSTDEGVTWTSLANEYTTSDHDPDAHPDIVANLPGLTGYCNSDDFVPMTFDLTAYAGQEVLIGFRYMTDWGTVLDGWFIQDATVSGTAVSLEPLLRYIPDMDWQVTIVLKIEDKKHTNFVIYDMVTCDNTECGITLMPRAGSITYYAIVSPLADEGYGTYHLWNPKPHCGR
ncbi:MAG: hypothetical protein RBG13Loki_1990 [Promethearchaeota archaeon CR_4]|nr:MAG: hypothetical protein RBG13Loki_1990 [Candidatus Lokiarchaeota archaeon CR_4]